MPLYDNMYNPYDLLAELIARCKGMVPPRHKALDQKEDERIRQQAVALWEPYQKSLKHAARLGLDPQVAQSLRAKCEQIKDYHTLRWLVIELDQYLTWEQFAGQQKDKPFFAMNDNMEQTQIVLIPKVPAVHTHYGETERRGAQRWYRELNERLHHCWYVPVQSLTCDGVTYTLENIIYQPEYTTTNREDIQLAFSPISNRPMEDTLYVEDTMVYENGNSYHCFTVNGVQDPDYFTERFFRLYQAACQHGADIVMAPEMLCSDALFEVDRYGYNVLLNQCARNADSKVPALVLAPTYAADKRNQLRVYNANGRVLLTQDKQYPFIDKKNGGSREEDLSNGCHCIELLHIPYWGRLAFPICIDFLQTRYRDILIRDLGANLLLCPAYSAGSTQFEQAMQAGVEFHTACVWGNSCSSLQPNWSRAECTGAVHLANVGEKAHPLRFEPQCGGECKEYCMFLVRIPLNYAGPTRRQDIGPSVEHMIGDA